MRLSTGLAFAAMTVGALGAVWAQGSLPVLTSKTFHEATSGIASAAFGTLEQEKAPTVASQPATAPAAVAKGATPNATPPAAALAQATPAAASAPATTGSASAPAPTPIDQVEHCANPNALGVTRIVEVDTTGGPGFGFEHFKMHDFLRDKEVVLTFDDGPWPHNTPAVLKALADECTKAIFFPIGKHATWHPEILKQVAAAGHTIGSHTWSHANLNRSKTPEDAKTEIELGFSAIRYALGKPPSPFFRFPALQHPPAMVTYLGERNVAIFSTDMDSFDFKMRKPEQVVQSVMNKLHKFGKGIILMHDFQRNTAEALPTLLAQLKAEGFKVVEMKAKAPVATIAKYDEQLIKDLKLPTVSSRPTSSVIKTIAE